jgi:hypothetical protein
MIREPLAGAARAVPVAAATVVALASPAAPSRASCAPPKPATPSGARSPRSTCRPCAPRGRDGRGAGAVGGTRRHGPAGLAPDPAIERLVRTWPGTCSRRARRAWACGPTADFESIVREYVRENPQAVKLPVR